jgi:hypothetical protein
MANLHGNSFDFDPESETFPASFHSGQNLTDAIQKASLAMSLIVFGDTCLTIEQIETLRRGIKEAIEESAYVGLPKDMKLKVYF